MLYAGFVIRRERLNRNWSQEGLCKGICTVSYLSKIEQGKAEPSNEVLRLLMERMGLSWTQPSPENAAVIRTAYEMLLSNDPALGDCAAGLDGSQYLYSPAGPDLLLLRRFSTENESPLTEELEVCLDQRQLALQRLLQGRGDEAVRLFPCGFTSYHAGKNAYARGRIASALEKLQTAYQLASAEGRPWLMLYIRFTMGNCYSNQQNLPAMEQHYEVAQRLAAALGDESALASIAYNRAATRLELGQYDRALAYFEQLSEPGRMVLHKKAICYEKLGRIAEAREALLQAKKAPADAWMPEGIDEEMLSLVEMRVTTPEYLHDSQYGEKLLHCFRRLQEEMPSGYVRFHLPWVLEWYESNRLYKQALSLMKNFPENC